MALKISSQGLRAFLDLIELHSLQDCLLRLYQNDFTPTQDSEFDDFTEATFPGYTAIVSGSWTPAFINGDGDAEIDHDVVTWVATGSSPANTIYGYFVTDAMDNFLFGERNPSGGIVINATGQQYAVYFRYTYGNRP